MFSYYPFFYSVDFMNPPYKRGRCKSLLPNPTRKNGMETTYHKFFDNSIVIKTKEVDLNVCSLETK